MGKFSKKHIDLGVIPFVCLIAWVALSALAVHPACPQPHGSFGSSVDVPQSNSVVCLVDNPTPNHYELYSANKTSGAVVKLSQDTPDNRDVILFRVDPTGTKVAYTHDASVWTQYELYTVGIGGAARTKISGTIKPDHDVDGFVWSSRSDQVVFRYGRNATGAWDLFAVKAAGGSRVQLNPTAVNGGGVQPIFTSTLGYARYDCDCLVDETMIRYNTPLPNTIFGEGFDGGTLGGFQ